MRRIHYTLAGVAAILLWSSTVAVGRSLSEALGPITTTVWIYLLGGLAALLTHVVQNRQLPNIRSFSKKYLFGCGGLFAVYMISLYLALGLASDRSQVLEIGLINYLWPVLTVALSVPLLGEKGGTRLYGGLVLALVGICLVVTQHSPFSLSSLLSNVLANPAAYLLAMLAAVSWALYSNLSNKWGRAEDKGAIAYFMLATGIIIGIAHLFIHESSSWSSRVVLELTFLSLSVTAAYTLWDLAIRRGNFRLVAVLAFFTPLLATLLAVLYLGGVSGPKLWVGCLLVICGAMLSRRTSKA